MGRPDPHRKSVGTSAVSLLFLLLWSSCVFAATSTSKSSGATSYSKKFYQVPNNPQTHGAYPNVSGAVFEPRDSTGGSGTFGGTGSSYGVDGGGAGGYGGGGGGGYDTGSSYGAPAMPSPQMYKYQIYPSSSMQMQMGWGGGGGGGHGGDDDEDDDGGFDFPKELIGLLGLKGLKGLKGVKGVFVMLKVLLLLKKLLKIPLLPILLPLLLPLLLLKLAILLLPLLLILLLPVPVVSVPGGRLIDTAEMGENLKIFLQEKLDSFMGYLPVDLSHIFDKIKDKGVDMTVGQLLTTTNSSAPAAGTVSESQSKMGDTGSSKSKIEYVPTENIANIQPTPKSVKSMKIEKNKDKLENIYV